MNPEGKIHITLVWDRQRIERVDVQPRPLAQVGALLPGKDANHAANLIPMLFGICRAAQGAAASAALSAAQDLRSDPVPQRRERVVLAEALLEHLWRFLLDFPAVMNSKADPASLAQLRRRLAETITRGVEADWQDSVNQLEQVVSNVLLGANAAIWRDLNEAKSLIRVLTEADTTTATMLLACWNGIARWGSSGVALMPQADRSTVLAELAQSVQSETDFAQYPHWGGQLMETGALARMRHHPLLSELLIGEGTTIMARLLARLVEVHDLFARLRTPLGVPQDWVQSASLRPGTGLSWVQTARGLLMHRVELDEQGKVEDYCIVAPTEWNFHPAGPCVQGLLGKIDESAQQAQHSVRLMVHALDPCVSYDIEVEHA